MAPLVTMRRLLAVIATGLWLVAGGAVANARSARLACTDGDPTCDRDDHCDGACTFLLGDSTGCRTPRQVVLRAPARPHRKRRRVRRCGPRPVVLVCRSASPACTTAPGDCHPRCPDDEPAVWTGSLSPPTGDARRIKVTFCPDDDGRFAGQLTCTAADGTCPLAAAPFVGVVIEHALHAESALPDRASCEFDGTVDGDAITGTYRCQTCTIVTCRPGESGRWTMARARCGS